MAEKGRTTALGTKERFADMVIYNYRGKSQLLNWSSISDSEQTLVNRCVDRTNRLSQPNALAD